LELLINCDKWLSLRKTRKKRIVVIEIQYGASTIKRDYGSVIYSEWTKSEVSYCQSLPLAIDKRISLLQNPCFIVQALGVSVTRLFSSLLMVEAK